MSETFSGIVNVTNGAEQIIVSISGNSGNLTAGGHGQDGDLVLKDSTGIGRVYIDGQTGKIEIKNAEGQVIVTLGANGNLYLGGGGTDGDLVLRDNDGHDCVLLGAGEKNLVIKQPDGASIIELGRNGNLEAGGGGLDGDIVLRDGSSNQRIHLDAGGGNIWVGGNGADGDIVLFPQSAANTEDTANATIHLDGNAGDIILKNADCAEEFDVASAFVSEAEPGTVMIVDNTGKLRPASQAYDKRVAGIVSGGGKYRPGIILDRQHDIDNRRPLALMGKVYCKVDADFGGIEVGDLLTTSPTAGHAMKVSRPEQAFGTVIGKALGALAAGRGMVPVLVALQ